jgi:hypothetical protein
MKKANLFLIFFLTTINITSCNSQLEKAKNSNYFELTTFIESETLDITMQYDSEKGMMTLAEPGEVTTTDVRSHYYWTYASNITTPEKFAVTVLFDYRQIPSFMNGVESLTHILDAIPIEGHVPDIYDPTNTSRASSVDLEYTIPVEPGCHIVSFILFTHIDHGPWVDNQDTNEKENYSSNITTYGLRIGNAECENFPYSQNISDTNMQVASDYSFLGGVLISTNPSDAADIAVNRIIAHETNNSVYLHTSSSSTEENPYLLLAFLNWEQIPIKDNAYFLSGILKQNENRVYQIDIPQGSGPFLVIRVDHPFARGFSRNEQGWVNFNVSERVFIQ